MVPARRVLLVSELPSGRRMVLVPVPVPGRSLHPPLEQHKEPPTPEQEIQHFLLSTHYLHPAVGWHPKRRWQGTAVSQGAASTRGWEWSRHPGSGPAGSNPCLQYLCCKTGLNGGWESSFLHHPTQLPFPPVSASSWLGLSNGRRRCREPPGEHLSPTCVLMLLW